MNFSLFVFEMRRRIRCDRSLFVSQGLCGLMVILFSFLTRPFLSLNSEIGICFFWLVQGLCLLQVSSNLFPKDIQQGFYLNVIQSQTSLAGFIFYQWIIFTFILTLCMGCMTPILLYLLNISLRKMNYFLLFLIPFNGFIGGYGGLLTLLTFKMKNVLLPLLLFPLAFPIFILVIKGSHEIYFKQSFQMMIAFFLLSIPFIIGGSRYIIDQLVKND